MEIVNSSAGRKCAIKRKLCTSIRFGFPLTNHWHNSPHNSSSLSQMSFDPLLFIDLFSHLKLQINLKHFHQLQHNFCFEAKVRLQVMHN